MAKRSGGISTKTPHRDRNLKERQIDSYKSRTKLPDPTECPSCGAMYLKGRWVWAEKGIPVHQEMCPACQRSRDRYPAGVVNLGGAFYAAHRDEILNLVRNEEDRIKADHPLHRIITIDEADQSMAISTTDTHLPRRIGEALRNAYKGDLAFSYSDGEQFVRVNWQR